MLNICLCDDDINVLKYYSNRICELSDKNNYVFQVETFMSGESLIFEVEENPNRFNIIIIDIIMKNIDGIETTKILRRCGYNGIIIFLTSSKEFALDSFKVEPLNYILKNDRDDRFNDIFLKAAMQVYENLNKNIIISSKTKSKVINLDTIVYMESLNKKVILHKVTGESDEINCVFKDIYDKVKNNGFIRCHKSYVVNARYIQTFNKFQCILQKDIIVPIGRKYSRDFKYMILENEFDNIII
ncbi:LytTR family DNA-binding domain-containing protein [Clostridium tertium]|uniref:response regulator transcription factor n=1 Tax=Clostridium tertium TaxID=1559 RepID=UPI00232E33A6|nr:LytTR family DNA-binding domain-containing protein [Clostridium tertium]MDB1934006.1 LytTR family DNA-binding domain-containing protein [Clostridium tertium]MDB1937119.1 LytTR family DNA-binding domain-containing protein [Clostridium tertium]